MTVEEVYDNYEFKVILRILKKEFPWVVNLTVEKEDLEKYKGLIFLTVHINPYKLSEYYDVKLWKWLLYRVDERKEPVEFMSLFSFVDEEYKEKMVEVEKDLKDTLSDIQNSSAIPDNLRLTRRPDGGNRRLDIMGFVGELRKT